jgi:hypothetical protein
MVTKANPRERPVAPSTKEHDAGYPKRAAVLAYKRARTELAGEAECGGGRKVGERENARGGKGDGHSNEGDIEGAQCITCDPRFLDPPILAENLLQFRLAGLRGNKSEQSREGNDERTEALWWRMGYYEDPRTLNVMFPTNSLQSRRIKEGHKNAEG